MRFLVAILLSFVGWQAVAECREGETTTVVHQVEFPGGVIVPPGTPATILKAGTQYLEVYFVAVNMSAHIAVNHRVLNCQ